jgi:hypothetical protein
VPGLDVDIELALDDHQHPADQGRDYRRNGSVDDLLQAAVERLTDVDLGGEGKAGRHDNKQNSEANCGVHMISDV